MLTKLRWIRPYLLAILTVVVALLAKWFAQPYLSTSPPFITFLAAIMFTAWHGGFRPALFATVLSTVIIDYYFIFPIHSFIPSLADFGSLVFFGVVATTLAYSIAYLQQARHEAVTIQKQLERLQEFSRRLLTEEAFESMAGNVLASALELLRADKGMIHLYDPEKQLLVLTSHIGFNQRELSNHFQQVPLKSSCWGMAFQRAERVIINNIATDPLCSHLTAVPGMSNVVTAHSMPLFRVDRAVFGVLTTYHTTPHILSVEELHFIDLYIRQAERVLETKFHEERLGRANVELEATVQALMAELASTEDRQRRDLASELHDYLAQLLTLSQLKLTLAQKFMSHSPGTSQRYLQEIGESIRLSLGYARTLMAELCPPELYTSGLVTAVQSLAAQMSTHGLIVEVDTPTDAFALSNEQAGLLYKTIRELLINVVKHADVDRARVSIGVESNQTLVIRVEDKGRGFDTSLVPTTTGRGVHFGLGHIRDRMTMMGGWYQEESVIGGGTTITLGLPLQREAESLRAASAYQRDRVKAMPPALPTQTRLPL